MKDQWIEWLQGRQRHFFYGIAATLALLFLVSQFLGQKKTFSSSAYIRANQAFQSWVETRSGLEALTSLINSHPDLETKFGSLIANRLILEHDADAAQPFADRVIARVFNRIPEHATYAEGSFLIAQGNYRDALSKAVVLKSRIDERSLLYGFNLMRIASLYRELSAYDQEVAALEDLENYLKKDYPSVKEFSKCFSNGNLGLSEYIRKRLTRSCH